MYKNFIEKEFDDLNLLDSPIYGILFEDTSFNYNLIIKFSYMYEEGWEDKDGTSTYFRKDIPADLIFYDVSNFKFNIDRGILIADWEWTVKLDNMGNKTYDWKIITESWKMITDGENSNITFNTRGVSLRIPDGFFKDVAIFN